jgi:RNA-directed DNA polymerase
VNWVLDADIRGWTLYCTRNRKGNLRVEMRTEKSRLRRSLTSLQELMQRIRHQTISEQADRINIALRGHYAYYCVAGKSPEPRESLSGRRALLA